MNDWSPLDYGIFIVLPLCFVSVCVMIPIILSQSRKHTQQRERIAFLTGQASVFERMNRSEMSLVDRYEALARDYDNAARDAETPGIAAAYVQMAKAERKMAEEMRLLSSPDSILDATEIE